MMNKNSGFVFGLVLIILGGLFLLNNLEIPGIRFNFFDLGFLIGKFWPALFLLLPGFMMHLNYFSGKNKDAGVLVPGGILLTIGITCQISMLFNVWDVMWPGFILSVAVGLFELYLFGTREKGLLVPVFILGGLSILFFFTISLRNLFDFATGPLILPLILILSGLLIIFKRDSRGKRF